MLTSLRIKNFKAWKDTGDIHLAPLTVIFGVNSAGKSSLGHLLLALKQTALSADRRRTLHLGDDNALIDLGTFEECIHNHQLEQPLSFELGWRLSQRLEVKDPVSQQKYIGDELSLQASLLANKMGQPAVSVLRYEMSHEKKKSLAIKLTRGTDGKLELDSDEYKLVRTAGRAWPLDDPDKFYRISDQSRARFQNSAFLADFALETEAALGRVHYLGPLRDHPRRIYQWSGDTPESVGQRGEYGIAAILAAQAEGRTLNRGPKKKHQGFAEFIADWLKDLGLIHSFSVKPLAEGRKEYEVLVKTHPSASEVKITDVGFGISQVLPALVQAFYCQPNSTIWMEQPEIHLHPRVQSELADIFIAAIQAREKGKDRNVQLIVESHSEHLLNRLQRRIAEGVVTPDQVAIYFCKRVGGATELEPLKINLYGEIENWPEDFFGDEMAEVSARIKAAMERKIHDKGSK